MNCEYKYKVSEYGASNSAHVMDTPHGWEGVFDLILQDIQDDNDGEEVYEHSVEFTNDADLLITWEEKSYMWIVSYSDNKGMYCTHHLFLYLALVEMLKQLNNE